MAQRDPELQTLAANFVRVRIVRMQGVDIELFQFDWDLTWAAFFMNRHGHIYARYGARKSHNDAEELLSTKGLAKVMSRVLEDHRTEAEKKPLARTSRLAESLKTVPPDLRNGKTCMHCHMVWRYSREERPISNVEASEVYPLPENLGMTFDRDLGNQIASMAAKGAAAKAGVQEKDEIVAVNGIPVYSVADASWAFHRAKERDTIKLDIFRAGERKELKISPPAGWKRRDISWRGSTWSLRPDPGFGGKMLSPDERSRLGTTWAIRVNYFTGDPAGSNAKQAGLLKDDIITTVGGKSDFVTHNDFQAWFRLTQKPGTVIELSIVRNGKPMKLRMKVVQ